MHEINEQLFQVAQSVLLAFSALSLVDGIYIHLIRLRLHAQPSAWLEHVTHTLRAILFIPTIYSLFAVMSGGVLLWTGIAFVVVDQAVELWDLAAEKESRAPLGGLSTVEYTIHVMLTALRSAAIVLSLAARPASAFSPTAPNVLGTASQPFAFLILQLVVGGIFVAVVHVILAWKYRPGRRVIA